MGHREEAERMLEFAFTSPENAIAHALLALVDKLDSMPVLALQVSEEPPDEGDDEDD